MKKIIYLLTLIIILSISFVGFTTNATLDKNTKESFDKAISKIEQTYKNKSNYKQLLNQLVLALENVKIQRPQMKEQIEYLIEGFKKLNSNISTNTSLVSEEKSYKEKWRELTQLTIEYKNNINEYIDKCEIQFEELSEEDKKNAIHLYSGAYNSIQEMKDFGLFFGKIENEADIIATDEVCRKQLDYVDKYVKVNKQLAELFLQNDFSNQLVQRQEEILKLVNEERKKEGITPLELDKVLNLGAQFYAEDMSINGYFYSDERKHLSMDGKKPNSRCNLFGENCGVGENSSYARSSEVSAMNGWMNSPGHRANILNPSYKYLGFGYGDGNYRVQLFSSEKFKETSFEDIPYNNSYKDNFYKVGRKVYTSYHYDELKEIKNNDGKPISCELRNEGDFEGCIFTEVLFNFPKEQYNGCEYNTIIPKWGAYVRWARDNGVTEAKFFRNEGQCNSRVKCDSADVFLSDTVTMNIEDIMNNAKFIYNACFEDCMQKSKSYFDRNHPDRSYKDEDFIESCTAW